MYWYEFPSINVFNIYDKCVLIKMKKRFNRVQASKVKLAVFILLRNVPTSAVATTSRKEEIQWDKQETDELHCPQASENYIGLEAAH